MEFNLKIELRLHIHINVDEIDSWHNVKLALLITKSFEYTAFCSVGDGRPVSVIGPDDDVKVCIMKYMDLKIEKSCS